MTKKDIQLLENIERYLSDEMSSSEKSRFEKDRRLDTQLDSKLNEYAVIFEKLSSYASRDRVRIASERAFCKMFKPKHNNTINYSVPISSRVLRFTYKYKKTIAIAAMVGGIIALFTSLLVIGLSPHRNELIRLSRDIENLKHKTDIAQDSKIPNYAELKTAGTAFLIDKNGYLITNAHVLEGSSVVVSNNKGDEFHTKIMYTDAETDLALLQIDDSDFLPSREIPYGISKHNVELGEEVFTLGYPRDEIVYNVGCMSAKTGFNGDKNTYQIQMDVNSGNSGAPLINKNGEIVGVLTAKASHSNGVVYAINSKSIFSCINKMKEQNASFIMPIALHHSSLKGMSRVAQVKTIEKCIFYVKTFNR